MFKIYPYKVGSQSVRSLKTALNAKVIRLEGSTYRHRIGHTIINWGNSRVPHWLSSTTPILNHPDIVRRASNKLDTLEYLTEAGVRTVDYTTDVSVAQDWVENGSKVFVRHTLTGHSGDGIEVIESDRDSHELTDIANQLYSLGYDTLGEIVEERIESPMVPDAPLYTLGVTNAGEYRVHVFNGEVILYQKKSRRIDEDGNVVTPEGEEADIRNLDTNWVYRTGNLRRLERIEQLAIDAIDALGLDFGAVDIIKDTEGTVYVLEVNSAPGLGNTETLAAYVSAFNSLS